MREGPAQVCLVSDLCDLERVHDIALGRERVEVEPCERVRRENGERDASAGEHEVHASGHVLDEVRQLHVVVLHTTRDVHQVHQVHLRRTTCREHRKHFSGRSRISHRELHQTQGDLLLPPANGQVNIFRSVCHSVHMGGLWSLYDVTPYLATWSHTPSKGLCPWSHIPFGGGGLCLGSL